MCGADSKVNISFRYNTIYFPFIYYYFIFFYYSGNFLHQTSYVETVYRITIEYN